MKKPIELVRGNEDEERDFWANIDLSEYLEPEDFDCVSFPYLKPTTRAISIRFPEYVLDAVKEKANAMGVPCQALIKAAVVKEFVKREKDRSRDTDADS